MKWCDGRRRRRDRQVAFVQRAACFCERALARSELNTSTWWRRRAQCAEVPPRVCSSSVRRCVERFPVGCRWTRCAADAIKQYSQYDNHGIHTKSTEIHATGYTTPYITTSRLAVHINSHSVRSSALEKPTPTAFGPMEHATCTVPPTSSSRGPHPSLALGGGHSRGG